MVLLSHQTILQWQRVGSQIVEATSATPFDVIYSPNTRAFVHEARRAQRRATPVTTEQTKKPAETDGLSLDILPDQLIALVEGSSPTLGTATPVRLNLIGVSFCSWLFAAQHL